MFFLIRSTDEALPKSVLDASQINLSMSGAILVTIVVNPLFAVVIVVMLVFFILMRKIYLKTSKNIKRLEGMSKKNCQLILHCLSDTFNLIVRTFSFQQKAPYSPTYQLR